MKKVALKSKSVIISSSNLLYCTKMPRERATLNSRTRAHYVTRTCPVYFAMQIDSTQLFNHKNGCPIMESKSYYDTKAVISSQTVVFSSSSYLEWWPPHSVTLPPLCLPLAHCPSSSYASSSFSYFLRLYNNQKSTNNLNRERLSAEYIPFFSSRWREGQLQFLCLVL